MNALVSGGFLERKCAMPISQISNKAVQEAIHFKDWVGWKVGWATGWYNPFDRLGDLVNPAELGTLVKIQGEFMQEQARLMADEAKVVQNLGDRINQIGRSGGQKG